MYQNYGFQQQQQPYQISRPTYQVNNNPSGMLKGRPVSSVEEARASMIDFDGSIFYFPDQANKKIYTKQINMDGTASMQVYELVAAPTQQQQPIILENPNYITRQEFEQAINQLREGTYQQTMIQSNTIAEPIAATPKLELNF